jgi:hypothetical protein
VRTCCRAASSNLLRAEGWAALIKKKNTDRLVCVKSDFLKPSEGAEMPIQINLITATSNLTPEADHWPALLQCPITATEFHPVFV